MGSRAFSFPTRQPNFKTNLLFGRDYFDIGWYLSKWKGLSPNIILLQNALTQTDWKGVVPQENNWKELLCKTLEETNWKKVLQDKQFDWKKNPKWWLYEKSVLATVHTLVDQYYGNYLKALETNNVSDWKFAEKEMKLLKKETVNEVKNKRKVAKKTKQEREMDKLVQGLSDGLGGEGGDELLPSDIFVDKKWSGISFTAKVIVVYFSANVSAEKIRYDLYLKQLQELKGLAKAKLAK